MEFRCPKCDSLIYSRKQKSCGQCGVALPPELLLSDAQIVALKKQREIEMKRAREFQLPESSDISDSL